MESSKTIGHARIGLLIVGITSFLIITATFIVHSPRHFNTSMQLLPNDNGLYDHQFKLQLRVHRSTVRDEEEIRMKRRMIIYLDYDGPDHNPHHDPGTPPGV
ncbi:hypothetical protein AKJ16_DCAP15785 [Drosera capensis]